jgi:hypothetical protein
MLRFVCLSPRFDYFILVRYLFAGARGDWFAGGQRVFCRDLFLSAPSMGGLNSRLFIEF